MAIGSRAAQKNSFGFMTMGIFMTFRRKLKTH
jgi:hypothetical protein